MNYKFLLSCSRISVFSFFSATHNALQQKTLENSLRFPAIASHQMESYTHDFSSRSPSQISRGVGIGLSIASFPSRRGIRKLYATSQQQIAERKGTKSWLVLGWRKKREQEEDCQQSARQRPKAFTEFNELSVHTSSPYFFFYAISTLGKLSVCCRTLFVCAVIVIVNATTKWFFLSRHPSPGDGAHEDDSGANLCVVVLWKMFSRSVRLSLCANAVRGDERGGYFMFYDVVVSVFSLSLPTLSQSLDTPAVWV